MNDYISRIEATLEAGPTPAEWEVTEDSRHIYSRTLVDDGEDSWLPLIAVTDDDETLIAFEANARYIAACNPVAIRALLDERDRLRQIAYDAATSLESISKLAGLVQYMDTMSDIRAYARSRTDFARAALEDTDAR